MFKKDWLYETPYILLATLIVFFLGTHSPNYMEYDASSYINFDPIRPPLYPIFIWLFHWAGAYQFTLIIWIHAIASFSALLYARFWLKKYLKISDFLIFMMCVIVTFTILFHFQVILIGSEGITFPLFIFTFFVLIECFKEFNIKKLFYLAMLISLLVLTRLQLYYFYILFVLLYIWYAWKKIPIKKSNSCIAILLASMLFTFLTDRSYHYFMHGYSLEPPAIGRLLIEQPLFLTTDNHVLKYFTDPKQKKYVEKMLSGINQKQLNKDAGLLKVTRLRYYELAYQEYNRNYIEIGNIVFQALDNLPPAEASKITKYIAEILVLHEPKINVLFFLWKFAEFMGGVDFFLFFSMIPLALIIKIFSDKALELDYSQLFVAMIFLVTFLNAGVVSVFEAYNIGYFCYSQFMLYCLGIFLVDKVFLK